MNKTLSVEEKEDIRKRMVEDVLLIEGKALKEINAPVDREMVLKIINKYEEILKEYEVNEDRNGKL